MKKSTMILGALFSSALVFSSQSFADSGWYISGKVGQSELDIETFKEEANSYGLAGGFRFSDYVGLQVGYTEYGQFEETETYAEPGYIETGTLTGDLTAISLVAIGSLPLSDSFSLFGKLGLASWDIDVKATYVEIDYLFDYSYSASGRDSDSGTDLVYGIGANWSISDLFGLSFEYEVLDYDVDLGADADAELNTMSLGAVFSF